MTKKKWIFLIGILLLTIIIVISWNSYLPKAIIKDHTDVLNIFINYKGRDMEIGNVDTTTIIEYLSEAKCKKTNNSYFPFNQEDILIDITINTKHELFHVILGNFNVKYSDATFLEIYEIVDPEPLKEKIIKICETSM